MIAAELRRCGAARCVSASNPNRVDHKWPELRGENGLPKLNAKPMNTAELRNTSVHSPYADTPSSVMTARLARGRADFAGRRARYARGA
jgi:hypothetical protein